jgi:acetyltransferase (GNAT) family protein
MGTMVSLDDFEPLQAWVEGELGMGCDATGVDPVPVVAAAPRNAGDWALWGVRWGERGILTTRSCWLDRLQGVVQGLTIDELFSTFGAYEIARVTLPDGVGVWGPSWYFAGDERHCCPQEDARVTQLTRDGLHASVDSRAFWHCFLDRAVVGFGRTEEGAMAALATVRPEADGVWMVGVDVVPGVRCRALGKAVAGAACRWIMEQGGIILAKSAPWNVPSVRLFRALGLRHVLSDMVGMSGPFKVPPQQLGSPYAGATVHNAYPAWAMNQSILPRD